MTTELKTTKEKLAKYLAECDLNNPGWLAMMCLDALLAHKQEAILNRILAKKKDPNKYTGKFLAGAAEGMNDTIDEIHNIIRGKV